jgi:type VI secretion system protein
MMKFLKICLLGLVVGSLSACGSLGSVANFFAAKGNRLDWSGLTVIAAEGANLNTPVALDVVLLRDDATLGMVSTLSAAKWFASRADLAKTFPEGLSYRSMEIAPGQTLKLPASTFGASRLVGVMLFADYLSPGEHRMRVDQLQGDILVQLGARSFSVSAQKTEKSAEAR